jgi:Secretion system C-terminal sorting domain
LAKWNKKSLALGVVNQSKKINNYTSIQPNPANSKQTIQIDVMLDATIRINLNNSFGQKVKSIYHQKHNSGKIVIKNDISDLANGVYFYEVMINNDRQFYKIIKN